MDDDPALAEQAELACGRRAVEHRDDSALHVGRSTSADPPVAAGGVELGRVLSRDDVEVPVVVDELRPVAHAPAHDRRPF